MSEGKWYHLTIEGETSCIFKSDNVDGTDADFWGPFDSFSQARDDAIAVHEFRISKAKAEIKKIRAMKDLTNPILKETTNE